jgi:hypothetical protein
MAEEWYDINWFPQIVEITEAAPDSPRLLVEIQGEGGPLVLFAEVRSPRSHGAQDSAGTQSKTPSLGSQ